MLSCFSCVQLCNPWTIACQPPLPMGFSKQEHWTELPCPPLEDLPDPGIKPSPPALEGKVLITGPPGKSFFYFLTVLLSISLPVLPSPLRSKCWTFLRPLYL